MSIIALRNNKSRKRISGRIITRPRGLTLTKKIPYYDKEADELRTAIASLRTNSLARREHEAMLKTLTMLPHPPESMDGIPYYDEEFAMPQSIAHTNTVHLVMELVDQVATMSGLQHLSDNPVWYLDKNGKRKTLYPDYALTANTNLKEITAKELLLSLEVVSTSRIDKTKKDTERMREYNAWNNVPEFVLIYPDLDDSRSVNWYQYNLATESYLELTLPEDRRYRSVAIPGLEIEVLEINQWNNERKIRVYYQGQEILTAEQERLAKEVAEKQVTQERFAKEIAEKQVTQERLAKEVAEKQVAQERQGREQERLAKEAAERQIEQERLGREQERRAKENAERQMEQLMARLQQLGITI